MKAWFVLYVCVTPCFTDGRIGRCEGLSTVASPKWHPTGILEGDDSSFFCFLIALVNRPLQLSLCRVGLASGDQSVA